MMMALQARDCSKVTAFRKERERKQETKKAERERKQKKKNQKLPRSASAVDARQGQDGGALSMSHLQGRQAARCTTGACVWRARVRAIPCVRACAAALVAAGASER